MFNFWKHKTRGSIYREIGIASLQAGFPVGEGQALMIYRGADGKLWARPEGEFRDGRFEEVGDLKDIRKAGFSFRD